MVWSSANIATWSASVGLKADGTIASYDDTVVSQKSFSVKGQDPTTEAEDNNYGYLGNAFSEIFGLGYLSNISRKVSDSLE